MQRQTKPNSVMVAFYLAKPFLACRWTNRKVSWSVASVWWCLVISDWLEVGTTMKQAWNIVKHDQSHHKGSNLTTWLDPALAVKLKKGPTESLIPGPLCLYPFASASDSCLHLHSRAAVGVGFRAPLPMWPNSWSNANNSDSMWTYVNTRDSSRNLEIFEKIKLRPPSPAQPMEELRVWWLNVQGTTQCGFDHFYGLGIRSRSWDDKGFVKLDSSWARKCEVRHNRSNLVVVFVLFSRGKQHFLICMGLMIILNIIFCCRFSSRNTTPETIFESFSAKASANQMTKRMTCWNKKNFRLSTALHYLEQRLAARLHAGGWKSKKDVFQ